MNLIAIWAGWGRAAWKLSLVCACVAALILSVPAADEPDRGIVFLAARVQADPDDFIAWNQLGERYLAKLRESGNMAWLQKAAEAADASLKAIPEAANAGGLALRSRVDLALHRFADARDRASRLGKMQPAKTTGPAILADALLELGALEEAAKRIDELEALDASAYEIATRRARLAIARGKYEDAVTLFTAARDGIRDQKPPRADALAWCEVQLGSIAFRTGRWDAAENHYEAALKAVPEWWSALDHVAELRAAQGRTAEAFAIWEKLIERIPRPELLQAVGDLHLFLRNADAAKPWHDRALAAYREAARQGSVAYDHHMAGFFSDSQPDPAAAVASARKDLEIRQTAAAHDALAWALYKSGDVAGAGAAIAKALATGTRDPHILYHAGMIRISAGDVAAGQAALREAAAVNPRINTFHVHR